MSAFNEGPRAEQGVAGYTDFGVLCSVVSDRLYSLTANIKLIQRLLVKLGTPRGSFADEQRLSTVLEESTVKFRMLGDDIKALSEWDASELSAAQKFTQRSLGDDFSSVADEFRISQRKCLAKQQQLASEASHAATEQAASLEPTERTPLMEQQQQPPQQQKSQILDVVAQDEVDFMATLVQERETEISNIQSSITEVNAIFRDLGTLVSQQGDQIDDLENNVTNLVTNTSQAAEQLKKAENHQKSRSKWSCIVLLVLLVVVLLISLAVLS